MSEITQVKLDEILAALEGRKLPYSMRPEVARALIALNPKAPS